MGLFSSVGKMFGVSDGSVEASEKANASIQAAAAAAQAAANPNDTSSVFGQTTFDDEGNANVALSDPYQQFHDQRMATANQFAGDPFEAANQYYGLMSPFVQQDQQNDNLSLENRLRAQGRLGGTGGQNQYGRLQEAHERTNSENRFKSVSAAQDMMQRAFGDASKAGSLPGIYAKLGIQSAEQQGRAATAGLSARASGYNNLAATEAAAGTGWSNALAGLDGLAEAGMNAYPGGASGMMGDAWGGVSGLFGRGGGIQSGPADYIGVEHGYDWANPKDASMWING